MGSASVPVLAIEESRRAAGQQNLAKAVGTLPMVGDDASVVGYEPLEGEKHR
jgi:hypothetical protein